MKQLTLSEAQAKNIYPTASAELQVIMEETFGKAFFLGKITDRVKTFEDACKLLGIEPQRVFTPYDKPHHIAEKKLEVIIQALNEGREPDWNNGEEKKWYNWFYLDKPGFRFANATYSYSYSSVSFRLCFKSEELAVYAAKQFLELYRIYYTGK